jgi:hypothetical protein
MIYATSSRSGKKTEDALKTMKSGKPFKDLDPAGRRGVDALSRATPRDTGETADSWGYQTNYADHRYSLSWFNTHNEDGANIAVILQYGHATRNHGWVEGQDYINPAIQPIMRKAIDDAWEEVRRA